jgi:DNA-binding NarL/FixJ family response regulator
VGVAEVGTVQANHALTLRELEVLRVLATGRTDKEIAATLRIRPRTVSKHVSTILLKLDATSRTEAVALAIGLGIIASSRNAS